VVVPKRGSSEWCACRVGQNHIRCIYDIFLQGNHQIYGHIRCVYTVLANPMCMSCTVEDNMSQAMTDAKKSVPQSRSCTVSRIGETRIYTPYTTVGILGDSLPIISYIWF